MCFFWAGFNIAFTIYLYFRLRKSSIQRLDSFFLAETKGRTFHDLDLLFERKVPARRFASTQLTTLDQEAGQVVSKAEA
jgi:SP family general alpha glucoside:H+ symporter-like MFS transporter